MSQFTRLLKRSSAITDQRLSDCWVTIGSTAGLASSLRPPVSPDAIVQDDANLKYRGIFESPFDVELDREGYSISVGMETPIPIGNTQNVPMLRRNDRLLIELDSDDSLQLVYGIKSVQPDGKWRVLLTLGLMGPMCDTSAEYVGLPLVLPFVLGGRSYNQCINLNGGQPFMVDGKFIE